MSKNRCQRYDISKSNKDDTSNIWNIPIDVKDGGVKLETSIRDVPLSSDKSWSSTAPSWEFWEVAGPEVLHESLPGKNKKKRQAVKKIQEKASRICVYRTLHLHVSFWITYIYIYDYICITFITKHTIECKWCTLHHFATLRTAELCHAAAPSVSQPNESQARGTYFTPRRSMAKYRESR